MTRDSCGVTPLGGRRDNLDRCCSQQAGDHNKSLQFILLSRTGASLSAYLLRPSVTGSAALINKGHAAAGPTCFPIWCGARTPSVWQGLSTSAGVSVRLKGDRAAEPLAYRRRAALSDHARRAGPCW